VLSFEGRPAALVVAADVTARVAAEAALINARDDAEAASRAKSDFLANMSHELRTPLNAILGFSEMIAQQIRGPVGEAYRGYAADIHRSGLHLLGVVNDVLDLAKAEAGAMTLDLGEVDLGLVVAEAVHMLARKAETGGVALAVDIRAAPRLSSDAQKLRQILLNLISNAVKFTPAGGTITVCAREVAGEAIIEVLDTGPGVPVEERESIFNLFFRGQTKPDGSTVRVKGSGLGLAIARELVEAHGGHIAVVGGGAGGHFRVTLPRRSARALADAA